MHSGDIRIAEFEAVIFNSSVTKLIFGHGLGIPLDISLSNFEIGISDYGQWDVSNGLVRVHNALTFYLFKVGILGTIASIFLLTSVARSQNCSKGFLFLSITAMIFYTSWWRPEYILFGSIIVACLNGSREPYASS